MASGFEKCILCIGAGYVGGPTMSVIATKCQCLWPYPSPFHATIPSRD